MRLPRLNLTSWILAGFILGILTGLFFGDLCSVMKPASEAFIKIWQITILPSVALSLIVGIGSLKRDTAKAIALKAGLILLLFWAICVIGYFSFQLAFPPRMEASFFSTQDLVAKNDINLIDQFIPSNPFLSLSDGIIPATVLFCLFLGFALMLDDGSGPILSILRALLRALDRMTHIIAATFPVGIFVITAVMAGTLTIEGFLELQVFLITLAAAAVLLGLVVMPLLVTCFTTFHYRDILAASSRAMLLAFSTGTEFITLPLISEGVEKLFQGQDQRPGTGNASDTDRKGDRDPDTNSGNDTGRAGDEQDPGDIRSYSEILVPVAYTFPLLGGLVPFLFILFVAWLYQNPLDLMEQVQLIVLGIPSFFGSSKVSVISLLDLMHLPADAYNLYISSGILRQAFVAPLSVISIFAFTTITIALTTNRARFRWKRAAMSLLAVLLLAALLIAGLHVGFTYLLAGTYHGGDQISRIELPPDRVGRPLTSVVNTTVYLHKEDVPAIVPTDNGRSDEVRQIRERGVLRVGYNSNNVPFVFFNGRGELVGYDVEMAYDLARTLNVSRIEFVPITGTTLAESLDSGYCDIIMAAVMVNQERFEQMKFTDPVVTVHMAFVVPDGKKTEFTQLENVKKMDGLRVAVFNNTVMVTVARKLLPRAIIVPIDSREEFFEAGKADALIIPAEEGYTLTLLYPFFDVAIIEPYDSYLMMYGYPVARNSSESYLLVLNYWIMMERDYGMLDKKYDYWVLGNIPGTVEPRWSVVRNVLHWET
ncbi:MAG: cation:dicarboxylase symporter family transporter [Methanoregula sp.]|jgi:Na+/H+-dicarboxylate symporter